MKFIDLFCGIGSFHQALDGHECVMACDIDPMCRETYKVNYNMTDDNVLSDITDIKTFPKADIVCAGFPCETYSIIGKKQGLSVKKGQLIYDVFRAISQSKPNYVFMENVRNILKHQNILDLIHQEMTYMGYSVKVHLLNCKNHGIPQSRQRVFFICCKEKPFLGKIPECITPTLSSYLNQDLIRDFSYTIRAKGGRYDKIDSRHNWTYYRKKDNTIYQLTFDDVVKLQGFPSNFFFCGSTTSQYQMLGNSIPTCLTKAVISATLMD
jgi:DNA (cytosine-5)-methyltransferase 1